MGSYFGPLAVLGGSRPGAPTGYGHKYIHIYIYIEIDIRKAYRTRLSAHTGGVCLEP